MYDGGGDGNRKATGEGDLQRVDQTRHVARSRVD